MKKMYIIKYSGGNDDCYETNVFVTHEKSSAIKYIKKFNRILEKWKEYYKQYEYHDESGMNWIKDEYLDQHFNRWNSLRNINKCYWNEIEFR